VRCRKWFWALSLIIMTSLGTCSKSGLDKKDIQSPVPNADSLKAEVPFDGEIVFQSDMDGDNEIYLLTSKALKKLTDNAWSDEYPRWLPDGKALIYVSERDGQHSCLIQVPLPTGAPSELIRSKEIIKYPALSPNGLYLAYVEFPRKSPPGLTGEGSIRLFRIDRNESKQIRLPSGHRPFQ
jgi:Tol biopolymer transport system component